MKPKSEKKLMEINVKDYIEWCTNKNNVHNLFCFRSAKALTSNYFTFDWHFLQ